MMTFEGVEELRHAVGTHLGYSDWHTITQEQINDFARTTGDHQWIHVDPARAGAGPFGAPIAHGFLTLSIVPMLTGQVYVVAGVSAGINYGANRLRFPSPVPVGSQVRAGVEVLGVISHAIGYQVETRVTVELADSAKPACVVDMLAMVVP